MDQIKNLSTVEALRSVFLHMAILFVVIFPVGILVLLFVKFLVSLIFSFFSDSGTQGGLFWLFSSDMDTSTLDRIESSTLLNCASAYVALVVFMIRALLRMGDLPSTKEGMITLHTRLGFRMIALPLVTVLICTFTALGVYLFFSSIDNFVDTYMVCAWVVMIPTTIGTWIWVWRGAWITSIHSTTSPIAAEGASNPVSTSAGNNEND